MVLPLVKSRPFSDAYLMGDILAGDGFLDMGASKNPSKVANPAHAFRLQWHRAIINHRIEGVRLQPEIMTEMTKLLVAQSLFDIINIAKKDANYTLQPERYPSKKNIIYILLSNHQFDQKPQSLAYVPLRLPSCIVFFTSSTPYDHGVDLFHEFRS